MIDKALILMMFFYAAGFSILGVQYTMGDVFNVTMVSPVTGEPLNSAILGYLNEAEFNERTANIASANFTTNSTFYDKVETFTTSAAYVAWELVTLMSGTYIFYMLIAIFGGSITIWVYMFIALYFLLLARAIIGYVRGV